MDATRLLILIFLRSSKLSAQFAWRVQDPECWHHQHRLWHWWCQHSESWVVILSSGLHTKPFQTNQLYNPSLSKLWLSVWILLHVLHIYAVIYLLWLRKEIVWREVRHDCVRKVHIHTDLTPGSRCLRKYEQLQLVVVGCWGQDILLSNPNGDSCIQSKHSNQESYSV